MINWFDIVVAIALILAVFNGYRKGLIMQMAGLGAIILGAVFAGKFAQIILPMLLKNIDVAPQTASVIAYIVAFAIIVLSVGLVGKMLQKIFETIHLSFINQILGSILSLATAMVILSALLHLVLIFDKNEIIIKPELKQQSFFYERVQAVIPAIVPYLNDDLWKEYIPKEYQNQPNARSSNEEKTTSILRDQHTVNNKIIHILQHNKSLC